MADELEQRAREVLADIVEADDLADGARPTSPLGRTTADYIRDIQGARVTAWQAIRAMLAFAREVSQPAQSAVSAFALGDRVEKISGSAWHGRVVGFYRTDLTADGICVESEREPGSVQIYPAKALRAVTSTQSGEVPAKPQGPAIPAGMKAWAGGKRTPQDWDGKTVFLRKGCVRVFPGPGWGDWRHAAGCDPYDIIAYTPRPASTTDEGEGG